MPDRIPVLVITQAGGAHVDLYLQALKAADACSEVLLADADGNWQATARQILGGKLTHVARDYKSILNERRPPMALITLEAKLAPPVIDAALDSGCHVLTEKPACVRIDDFVPLVERADSKHRYLMLALANRLVPEIIEARRLISTGQLGKLFGLEMHIIADQTRLKSPDYHKSWFAHKDRAGGGHLIWLGIHWLDLAMFMTGSAIAEVAGFTALVGGQPIRVEDAAAAVLKFDNGMLGTMTSGYYVDKGYHSHIKLWGSEGWLQLEPTGDAPLTWYTTKGAGKVSTLPGPKPVRGYTPFVIEAVKACANMTEPPISNADGLRVLKTIFAIYSAAETGRAIKVEST
jgi:predicted dehydrogenase